MKKEGRNNKEDLMSSVDDKNREAREKKKNQNVNVYSWSKRAATFFAQIWLNMESNIPFPGQQASQCS